MPLTVSELKDRLNFLPSDIYLKFTTYTSETGFVTYVVDSVADDGTLVAVLD